jgi:hypothetical protein
MRQPEKTHANGFFLRRTVHDVIVHDFEDIVHVRFIASQGAR